MDVKRGYLIRFMTGFAAVAVAAALASCSGSGGDGDSGATNDFGSIARASIGSVTINPGETATVTPSASLNRKAAFTQGGGYVNAVTFDSDQPIVIRSMSAGDSSFFYTDGSVYGDTRVAYFYNWAWSSSDTTQTLVMPPLYSLADLYPSGDYTFEVYNAGSATATVNVLQTRKNDSNFSSGQIDLNLFVYRAGEDNPVIPSQAEAEKVVGYMNDIFGQAGVSVGALTVEFIDDTNAIAQVLDDAGMEAFLAQASRATSGRGDKGINCFIMPRLAGDTLGMDGSIPGPGIIHGTPKSGLIAQAAPLGWAMAGRDAHETDQVVLAKILAHEMGHYFGLFHTTESDGSRTPILSDRPHCGSDNDDDGDGTVTGPECRGKGADYLMFWVFDSDLVYSGNAQTTLSPMEGQMINTFPAVN